MAPFRITNTASNARAAAANAANAGNVADAHGDDGDSRAGARRAAGETAPVVDGDAMLAIDASERITFLNPVAESLTGWTVADATGQSIGDILPVVDEVTRIPIIGALISLAAKEKYSRLNHRALLLTRDEREYPVEGTIVAIPGLSSRPQGWVIILRDTSGQQSLAERVDQQLRRDPLTGLVNRREFEILAEELVCDASLTGRRHSAVIVDVDQFSMLNDQYGRGAGDALLRQVGDTLKAALRPADVVARVGNDEFGILLSDMQPGEALRIATQLLQTVRATNFSWRAQMLRLSLCAGVADTDAAGGRNGSLPSRADAACRNAKRDGGSRASVWQDAERPPAGCR